MSSGETEREDRRKGQQDINFRLKEIAAMLPVPSYLKGHTLTKQETLTCLLCYLKFLDKRIQELEDSLPADCIPRTGGTQEGGIEDALHTFKGDCMQQDLSSLVESDLSPIWEGPAGSEDGSPSWSVLDLPGMQSVLLEDFMLGPLFSADEGVEPLALCSLDRWGAQLSPMPHSKPEASLNLSPSFFASPSRDVTQKLFPETKEEQELQGLFEDVWLCLKPEAPGNATGPGFLPDDSLIESSKVTDEEEECGSGDAVTHIQPPVTLVDQGRCEPSSESEDESFNCTPTHHGPERRRRHSNRKKRFSTRGRPRSQPSPKKKCINGFIMFCQLNRKLYHRSYPGTPSSTVTKELAGLWRLMSKREQQVYCKKAWHFSRQQNRNVRTEYEG